jgi:hypothetical protein
VNLYRAKSAQNYYRRRGFHRLKYGLTAMFLLVVFAFYAVSLAGGSAGLSAIIMSIRALAAVIIGVFTGRAFAVGLIGVVIDREQNTITFGSDGVLRSLSDPKVIFDSIIPASVETLHSHRF